MIGLIATPYGSCGECMIRVVNVNSKKSIYVNILTCVKVKKSESEFFRIDRDVI